MLGPDGEIKLRPKSYELLRHLVRHPGRLVGREELLNAVWGHAAVTDDSLTQCLVEIRRALGDNARRIVRTVPRRGYLLDVPVSRHNLDDTPRGELDHPPPGNGPGGEVATAMRSSLGRGRLPAVAIAMVAGVIVAMASAAWLLSERDGAVPAPHAIAGQPEPGSIAVLPFVDMSAEQNQEYFGDGLAEEILNLLAQVPTLKVIARTSSFSFKDQPADIATIAAKLGVMYVLEGSVRKSGNRVRVTAQLIGTDDSVHRWSQSYDRELGDLIDVQSEIAAAVASVLKQELLARTAPARGRPRDPGAYDHFLRARFLFNRRDPGDLDRAREQFEAALQLDPALPEAHLRVLPVYRKAGERDKAAEHIRIAQSLDPDNVLLLGLRAGAALGRGEVEEAVALSDRIIAIDPLSRVSRFNRANLLMGAGRYQDARKEFMAVRELGVARAWEIDVYLAQVLVLEERYEEALAQLVSAAPGIEYDLCLALAQVDEAGAVAARLETDGSSLAAIALAALHAHRGEPDAAFAWLAESHARFERDGPTALVMWPRLTHVSPFPRPLRDDLRWAALQADVG